MRLNFNLSNWKIIIILKTKLIFIICSLFFNPLSFAAPPYLNSDLLITSDNELVNKFSVISSLIEFSGDEKNKTITSKKLLSFSTPRNKNTKSLDIIESILPLEFSQGMPSVIIEVQGKKLPLIFDTGASKTELVLSEYALQDINHIKSEEEECFNATNGEYCHQIATLPTIQIGEFTLHDVKVSIMGKLWGGNDKGFIETEASKSGVIGLDLLKNFNVMIDYKANKVVLTNLGTYPKNYDLTEWKQVSFTLQYGITTEAVIYDIDYVLVWDTGAIPGFIRQKENMSLYTVDCEEQFGGNECQKIKSASFFIDGIELPSLSVLLDQDTPEKMPFDGLVGAFFHNENAVFIDFLNQKLFIKPYDKPAGVI